MTNIGFKDLGSLNTPTALIDEIARVLYLLGDAAAALSDAEITDKDTLRWFSEQTKFLQPYYVKLEQIV